MTSYSANDFDLRFHTGTMSTTHMKFLWLEAHFLFIIWLSCSMLHQKKNWRYFWYLPKNKTKKKSTHDISVLSQYAIDRERGREKENKFKLNPIHQNHSYSRFISIKRRFVIDNDEKSKYCGFCWASYTN